MLFNNDPIVVSKLPDAGLGNKLFTWAHGVVFAKQNNLRHYSIGFTKFKMGPIIRRETSLRFYKNYFKSSTLISKIVFFLKKNGKTTFVEYKECNSKIDLQNSKLFIFNQIPHWSDYFLNIRENRDIVVNSFSKSLSANIYSKYQSKSQPIIGIHIRMGDFKKLAENTSFEEVGHTRTPLNYFVNIINGIRKVANKSLEVTIFTDGKKSELQEILTLENVAIAEDDLDILQMLHLSKSKIIVLSAGSTFGQWAAFFSSAVIINHYQHFHSYIRNTDTNNKIFEGIVDPEKALPQTLISNIQNL